MNFIKAVEQMEQGKKVRLIQNRFVLPWIYKDRIFQIVEGDNIIDGKFGIHHFKGDWEVVEEPKKTLWDKINNTYPDDDCPVFCVDDVKEALKEFIGLIDHQGDLSNYLRYKAKEIFGEELLK